MHNFGALMARKDKVVKTLVSGVEFLFKKNGVKYVKGKGKLVDPHTVEVTKTDGGIERITAASIIIATGSEVQLALAAQQQGQRCGCGCKGR